MGDDLTLSARLDNQLAAHFATTGFILKVTVEGEGAGALRTEFEAHRLSRSYSLGNPIIVDRQAVRDIFRAELDPDEVVLEHLDAGGSKRVTTGDKREQTLGGSLGLERLRPLCGLHRWKACGPRQDHT